MEQNRESARTGSKKEWRNAEEWSRFVNQREKFEKGREGRRRVGQNPESARKGSKKGGHLGERGAVGLRHFVVHAPLQRDRVLN